MKFASTGKEFENAPAGVYPAVCVKMVDLGHQETTWQGATKMAHKVMIAWELSEKMSDGRPFLVSSYYTVSLHENAQLRKHLASWRGKDFTEIELQGFDPKVLIGKGCMLSLIEKEVNGKTFINVDAIMRLPKGMEAPVPEGETIFFSLSEFDQKEFDKLSDKVKEKIMKSPEYQSLNSEGARLQKEQDADLADDDVAF